MANPVTLILGDQLFPDFDLLPTGVPVVMIESRELCTHFRYHKHKLILFLSAMRHYRDELSRRGFKVIYSEVDLADTYVETLLSVLDELRCDCVWLREISDEFASVKLISALVNAKCDIHWLPSAGFSTTASDWQEYRGSHRRLRMGDFYQWQRKRFQLLIESDGSPTGGKWSFDESNRRRIPADLRPPVTARHTPDDITLEVMEVVDREFQDHPGRVEDFAYAVTRSRALHALTEFLEARLDLFGPYEDAMLKGESDLWHSGLSPYLNIGLLTPEEVVAAAVGRHASGAARIESVEGFARQILGWREFIRGIDREYGNLAYDQNPFGNSRHLNPCWYEGTTGLPPLDDVIQRVKHRGYCHHIERLMVIGAVMLMSEVAPSEAYRWFMEMFVDSADWVMRPNVYGMSQFADGALFATKPYISGSAYILKMSDYAAGDWCEVWDGLYWRFIRKNSQILAANPRMSLIVQMERKLDPERRTRISGLAEAFIDRVSRPA